MTEDIVITDDIVLLGVVGSSAYGLATPDSDVDRLGVFLANTRDVLGLDGASVADRSRVRHEPDVSLHELGKYLRLALRCNPTILELLYSPTYEHVTDVGQGLIDIRSAFLSENAVRGAFGKYAYSQARELLARNESGKKGFSSSMSKRTEKNGRHCFRLMLMGGRLLRSGEMNLDVSERREELFAMGRLAESDPVAFKERFDREMEKFDAIESCLPDRPDRDVVEAFLVETRIQHLL